MNTSLEDDSTIANATVMYRKVAKRGDRVKHYGQRWLGAGSEGTATVVGFAGGYDGWIAVLVLPDRAGDLYGNTWDWDRTEVVP